jgi:hypothetical protein
MAYLRGIFDGAFREKCRVRGIFTQLREKNTRLFHQKSGSKR